MTDLWYKTAFGAHYKLLYSHRNDEEARCCLDLLQQIKPLNEGQILDLGCGDGRHLEFLMEDNLPVIGLDLSSDLLQAAQSRFADKPAALVRADMRAIPFADQTFSSVLSLFTAFGYFGPLLNNRIHVAEIARVLTPGGCWYFDYFNADKVRAEMSDGKVSVNERELGPCNICESKSLSTSLDTVRKKVKITPRANHVDEAMAMGIPVAGINYTEEVAVFDLEELDALAAEYNLDRIASAGGYQGQDLTEGDRWIIVYQKTKSSLMVEE